VIGGTLSMRGREEQIGFAIGSSVHVVAFPRAATGARRPKRVIIPHEDLPWHTIAESIAFSLHLRQMSMTNVKLR
jgi:hypothetical protein